MSGYSRSRRKVEKNDSSNVNWNFGDPIPIGAGLPVADHSNRPIESKATFGLGTLEDPCVQYRCRTEFEGNELDQFNSFARWICRELNFTHIWIRAHVHTWKTRRDNITKQKTRELQHGEDSHLTIYLGYRKDWINVHGDVYVESVPAAGGSMPIELMAMENLQPQNGQPPRNLRLYAWTPNMTKAPSAGHTRAMTSSNWRAK
ncbi:hypothetical protein F4679DRAFT_586282 [Xylaria curta]|nr:hypothetical protein F4679DRAFT_586282 [Xylaria curta]